MSETPIVSIVMPVYNRAAMLREAIASALREAHEVPLEIIAVDDASTDESRAVLQSYDPRLVRCIAMERNSGQAAARNRALDDVRGTYVKFLDSDDLLVEGHLAQEVRLIEDAAAEIALSGWIEVSDEGWQRTYDAPQFTTSIVDELLAGRAVPTGAALYRHRRDWRWDPALRKLDDWDYFCQAALGATRIASCAAPAYVMRHHGGARATNTTLLANAREHHRILEKIEQRLETEGRLTTARRLRLAQYFYKELRVLGLHDREAFEKAAHHITELDPAFVPRDEEHQQSMRAAARVLGFRNAVLLHCAIKKMTRGAASSEGGS